MISKETFIEILNDLKEASEIQNQINKIFSEAKDNIKNDYQNAGGLMISHEDSVIKLLEDMFDTNMISYWVYDLEYGKAYFDGSVIDENNKNLKLSTSEELYDYLISTF